MTNAIKRNFMNSFLSVPKKEGGRRGREGGRPVRGGGRKGQIPLVWNLLVHKEFRLSKTVFALNSFILNTRVVVIVAKRNRKTAICMVNLVNLTRFRTHCSMGMFPDWFN